MRTKQERLRDYKETLELLDSSYGGLCHILTNKIKHPIARKLVIKESYPELYAQKPKDASVYWWRADDVQSRKAAVRAAIALCKENTTTLEDAKKGDRVWSMEYGWGTISEIMNGDTYSLYVIFNNHIIHRTFTNKGYLFTDHVNPTLFWDEIKFDIPTKPIKVEKQLTFKEFAINEGIDWEMFLDNCKIENQRWNCKISYYESMDSIRKLTPRLWLCNSFYYNTSIQKDVDWHNIDRKWNKYIKDKKNIKFE